MCKKFELVTGKASKGNIGELKGMTKMYRDAGIHGIRLTKEQEGILII